MQLKKNPARYVSYLALLIAVEVVLNRFLSINTNNLSIGFSFIPVVVAAALFGPIPAAIVNGMADLLGSILFPRGTIHLGIVACAVLTGFVYGLFLRSQKADGSVPFFPNIVLAAIVPNIVFGLFLNTLWIAMLGDIRTYWVHFSTRLVQFAIAIPLNLILIPILLRLCKELKKIIRK